MEAFRSRRSALVLAAVVAAALAAASLSLLFSAMGNGEPGPSGVEAASVQDIYDALDAGGVDCRDRKLLPPPETLDDFGLCFLPDRTHEIDIYVFGDPGRRDSWLAAFDDYSGAILVGETWLITTGTNENARTLQEALGGRIRSG